jgi:hypothetical protein
MFSGELAALGAEASKESFYDMLNMVVTGDGPVSRGSNAAAGGAAAAAAAAATTSAKKEPATKKSNAALVGPAPYNSARITQLFAKELTALKDDPEFEGSTETINYLKDVIALDEHVPTTK